MEDFHVVVSSPETRLAVTLRGGMRFNAWPSGGPQGGGPQARQLKHGETW